MAEKSRYQKKAAYQIEGQIEDSCDYASQQHRQTSFVLAIQIGASLLTTGILTAIVIYLGISASPDEALMVVTAEIFAICGLCLPLTFSLRFWTSKG